jgi:hypothetical protein
LLRLADGQFEALLTVDQGIEYQQNLLGLTISVVDVSPLPARTLTTSNVSQLSLVTWRGGPGGM